MRLVTLSIEKRPDQLVNVYLKNEYDSPLMAFLVGRREDLGWGTARHTIPRDMTLAIPSEEGIPAGRSMEVEMGISTEDASHMEIHAAVFEDGSVTGDPDAVNVILETRRKAFEDIPKAIEMLSGESASIDQFRAWMEADGEVAFESALSILGGGSLPIPLHPMTPWRVIRLFEEGKTASEIVPLLNSWRDRLAQSKPILDT
jgi:hypothetical protein